MHLTSKRKYEKPLVTHSATFVNKKFAVELAAGPPVQLEPVDLSVKTPVVLQVPRYNPAVIISAAARRVPSPSTTPTPPPASLYVSSTDERTILADLVRDLIITDREANFRINDDLLDESMNWLDREVNVS
uniref:Uncharacterized protein n=1 Tax=Vespula pensylvanica TaxID=30213 RepID=A0A834KHZ4_VESPE|nr:hypothetical protein H0235_014538 [Vespula pensylvanica]